MPNQVASNEPSELGPQWRLLDEELRSQGRSHRIQHAYMTRVGISDDEDEDKWISFLLNRRLGAQRLGKAKPYWANTGLTTSIHFGDFDGAACGAWYDSMDTAAVLIKEEPFASLLGVSSWLQSLYVVAWLWPSVGYKVEQYGFAPDGRRPLHGEHFNAERRPWECGNLELPDGRHFCMLSRDVLSCSRSAIVALHSGELKGLGAARYKTFRSAESEQAVKLEVPRWSDLAIGIDEDGGYLAVSPVPDNGAVFPKEKSVRLDLPGDRWKRLLQALSTSEDGKTVPKKDLLVSFGHVGEIPKEKDLAELRNDRGSLQQIKKSVNKLAGAIGDLNRELRKQVHARDDKRRANPPMSASDSEVVCANFTTRHLLRDRNGKLQFVASEET